MKYSKSRGRRSKKGKFGRKAKSYSRGGSVFGRGGFSIT